MLIKIAVVVSLCSNVSMSTVNQTVARLTQANPGAKVTVRMDKKCTAEKQAAKDL